MRCWEPCCRVGATAESDSEDRRLERADACGEREESCPSPITVTNGREPLGEAALTLTVVWRNYCVDDYALN